MNELNEYDDTIKGVAWATFWEGYKRGKSVESYDKGDKRTAQTLFERWWSRNAE